MRLKVSVKTMSQVSNPFCPTAIPASTHCKCCNKTSSLVAVMDAARSGTDVRAGYTVNALSGQAVYYYCCQSCGFTFTRAFDHWTPADFTRFIYNADYGRHDPAYADGERGTRTAADVCRQFGAYAAQLSVLDWGSGAGSFCTAMLEYGFARVAGYDPFVSEAADSPAGLYDMVTCFEVIEHVLEPMQLIESLAAHRKPQGAILISTLFCNQQVVNFGLENWHYCVPRNGHISFMTPDALMHCAKRAGLRSYSFSEKAHVLFDRAFVPAWLAPVLPVRQ
jgi:SAM-dependent methyltransferase